MGFLNRSVLGLHNPRWTSVKSVSSCRENTSGALPDRIFPLHLRTMVSETVLNSKGSHTSGKELGAVLCWHGFISVFLLCIFSFSANKGLLNLKSKTCLVAEGSSSIFHFISSCCPSIAFPAPKLAPRLPGSKAAQARTLGLLLKSTQGNKLSPHLPSLHLPPQHEHYPCADLPKCRAPSFYPVLRKKHHHGHIWIFCK